MKIYFDVKNQIITRTDRNQVIANSADYLEAEITFSAEWASMEKTMTFKNGNLLYTYVLVNDKILEENHLNLGVGTWKVSIQGVNEDKKIVTNECNLAVNASGWIGSEALPPESIWNQLLVIIQSLHTEVASTAALRSAVQKYIEDNYDALVKEAVIVDDVRAALDDMAEDGTLSDLLAPLVAAGMPEVVADQISAVVAAQIGGVVANQIGAVVASQITTPVNQAVKNYCDDNFSGWSGALDRGLTQPLMAAPADMVGAIKSALSQVNEAVFDKEYNTLTGSYFRNVCIYSTGEYGSNSSWKAYLYDVQNISRVKVKDRIYSIGSSTAKCAIGFYSVKPSDMPSPSASTVDICTGVGKVYQTGTQAQSVEEELDVPAGSKTLMVVFDANYDETISTDLVVQSVVITNNIQKNANDIEELKDGLDISHDTSTFNPITVLDAEDTQTIGIWNYAGVIKSETETQQEYSSFDKTAVVPGCQYTLYDMSGVYLLYNENGAGGTQSQTFNVLTTVTITIPNDKYYIGISRNRSKLSSNFKFTRDTPTDAEIAEMPIKLEAVSIVPDNLISNGIKQLLAPLKGKKIVNLGDSIFGNFRDDTKSNTSISTMIANRTESTTYNCGFGGCRMAATQNNYYDAFTCEKIAESIASGSWTTQDQALVDAEEAGSPAAYIRGYWADSLSILKGIDWDTIDIITIGYGTNDYMGEVTQAQFENALQSAIEDIQTAYPKIKILVVSPMWRWWNDAKIDSDHFQNDTGFYLYDYVAFCKTVSDANHVAYVDTYTNLGINQYNKLAYFNADDGTHPNLNGRQLRANRISSALLELCV